MTRGTFRYVVHLFLVLYLYRKAKLLSCKLVNFTLISVRIQCNAGLLTTLNSTKARETNKSVLMCVSLYCIPRSIVIKDFHFIANRTDQREISFVIE